MRLYNADGELLRGLHGDELLRHMRRLVVQGDWDCIKPYLRAVERREAGDPVGRERLYQARFEAGCCVGCGREPCGCGKRSPLFCEVCWRQIEDNRPRGMVVSGLVRVMQAVTRNRGGQ